MADKDIVTNGEAAAAILASAIGVFTMGVLTSVSEVVARLRPMLAFHPPAGPLSGRTTLTVAIWLVSWFFLHRSWKDRQVNFSTIFLWMLILVGCGLIGTFPPPFEELGELLRSLV